METESTQILLFPPYRAAINLMYMIIIICDYLAKIRIARSVNNTSTIFWALLRSRIFVARYRVNATGEAPRGAAPEQGGRGGRACPGAQKKCAAVTGRT